MGALTMIKKKLNWNLNYKYNRNIELKINKTNKM